jgi:hypothetical protein
MAKDKPTPKAPQNQGKLAVPATEIQVFTGEIEFSIARLPETGNLLLMQQVCNIPGGAVVVRWPAAFTGVILDAAAKAFSAMREIPGGEEAIRRAEAQMKGLEVASGGLYVPEGVDRPPATREQAEALQTPDVASEDDMRAMASKMTDAELAATERNLTDVINQQEAARAADESKEQ